mgnify:FL=1
MSKATKIQPRPTAVSEPYWQGCSDKELRLQFCTSCNKHQFYPRIVCSTCGSSELEWQKASGQGTIASFTVVRRGVSEAYTAPYLVALIDLAEGVRMMSQVLTSNPDDGRLRVGANVAVSFVEWSPEMMVPVFTLT